MLGPNGPTRALQPNYVSPNPYKAGRKSPLRNLQGGDNPKCIKIDIAHTYAIAGFGKDDLASNLIFLAVRCGVWGPGGFEGQLERAYDAFKAWCVANKKSTTITEFSKKVLKITSFLDSILEVGSLIFFHSCILAEASKLPKGTWERKWRRCGGGLVGSSPECSDHWRCASP